MTDEFYVMGWETPGAHIGGEGCRLFIYVPPSALGHRKVVIDGFEDYDLFMHRPTEFAARGEIKFAKTGWVISEGKSGFQIATGDTQVKALYAVELRLDDVGREGLDSAIERALGEHGPSPRYRFATNIAA